MNITSHIDNLGRKLEIRVGGRIDADNACGIIQHAIVEAYGSEFRELVLDLRGAEFDHTASLFRLHSLLQVFNSIYKSKVI